jgi:hypothetical protein
MKSGAEALVRIGLLSSYFQKWTAHDVKTFAVFWSAADEKRVPGICLVGPFGAPSVPAPLKRVCHSFPTNFRIAHEHFYLD